MKLDRRLLRATHVALAFFLPALAAFGARADPSDPNGIALYELESTRAPSTLLEAPLAISVISGEEITRGRPAVTLDEALDLVPGVFAQGGRNFAQDSRVSIRGYGARAQFGVRGVRLSVDGVPSTLPDGQTEVDSLDLSFVERIEVVRGPVSSLYGGGGGGTISVQTLAPTPEPVLRARVLYGTDHLSRYTASATGSLGEATGFATGLAWTRASGYRHHSRARQSLLFGKLEHELTSGTQLSAGVNAVWAPEAQDPGGLTAAQVAVDRKLARPDALTGDAREKLNQQKVSLSLRHPFDQGLELRAMAYALSRDFKNALPLFVDRRVDLDRTVKGGALLLVDETSLIRWTFGLDVDVQEDQRRNYENLSGLRGALTLKQSETVRTVGPFGQADFDLPGGFGAIAGLRWDWTEFKVGDRFPADGDHSDRRRFRHTSPRAGLYWSRSPALHVYANLATGFRVPTTTELRAADGSYSSLIDPEKTLGLEIGAKGVIAERLFYDAALFDLRIRNVAVPFEDGSGLTLFRDAGEVRRRGAELGLSWLVRRGVSVRASYTYADYRYTDYKFVDMFGAITDNDGRREPNTPMHSANAELRLEHPSGLFAVLSLRHFSNIEVNDANTANASGATLSDVRLGHDFQRGGATIQPFFGVRNWSNANYDQTLRVNAAAGRYYEPAPQAEIYAGVEVLLAR